MSERDCPFCRGRGRLFPRGVDPEVCPLGWTCDNCKGTGRYEDVKLIRAMQLGQRHPTASIGVDRIRVAVIDDLRAQRVEEMLDPESVEMQRLQREVDRLLRERAPLLASCAALAAELREQLATEVPA